MDAWSAGLRLIPHSAQKHTGNGQQLDARKFGDHKICRKHGQLNIGCSIHILQLNGQDSDTVVTAIPGVGTTTTEVGTGLSVATVNHRTQTNCFNHSEINKGSLIFYLMNLSQFLSEKRLISENWFQFIIQLGFFILQFHFLLTYHINEKNTISFFWSFCRHL